MAQTRIFISHSHHDNEWCRAFAAALTAIGYDVWFDEAGLQGGDAWVASIQREVQSREIFVIVLTPEAWESQWVQNELQLAIATRRRVVPVLLRNTQVSGFLLTTQWITVIGEDPQAAARAAIPVFEAPPAPGRNAAPQAATETLDDLIVLCRSLATEGRYTEALSACARALALDPKSVGVLVIKAWVLNAIGEKRLEGRTLYDLLLEAPQTYTQNAYLMGRLSAMFDCLSEDEVLQAYSLLCSATPHDGQRGALGALEMLGALQRLNRLDTAIGILTQVSDGYPRLRIIDYLRHSQQVGLAIRLFEIWYDSPPTRATLNDMRLLDVYAKVLADVGRTNDARTIHDYVVRIFESAYGDALRQLPLSHLAPWNGIGGRDVLSIYLAALNAIGRRMDAERLRRVYLEA